MIPVRKLRGVARIPTDLTAARDWMRRHGIELQEESCPGGVRHVVDPTDLPAEVRAALAAREAAAAGLPEGTFCPELDRRYLDASPKLRAEADRKERMAHVLARGQVAGLSKRARYAAVRKEFGEKGTKGAALRHIEKCIKGVSPANYAGALIRDQQGGAAPADCDPRAWDMLKADYLRPQKPAFTACYDRMTEAAAKHGWAPIPTERTLRRRLDREVPKAQQTLARSGRDAAKNLFPPQRRDRSVFAPCEAVNADGHTFDVFVTAPWRDKPFRPVLVAVQDLFSGKILGWRLGETECWPLVRLAFLDVLETHGVPQTAYLDNGRAFASKWMTGGTHRRFRFKVKEGEPQGLLTQLGVNVQWTTPYHGQAKPIERAFRDLCETIAKHPACAGAYTGNSPMAKPEDYGRRAMAWAEFEKLVATEIARHNAKEGRKGGVCAGRSFDQTYADGARSATIRKAGERQKLLFRLASDKVRARMPRGDVHLGGNVYWAEELVDLAGKDVVLRFDPDALHAGVQVETLDGTYICSAACIEDTGFNCAESAARHARARGEYMRKVRAGLEAQRQLTPAQVAKLLPDAPAPAPIPEPAAVRMVPTPGSEVIKAQIAREEAQRHEGQMQRDAAFSRVVDMLDRGEIQFGPGGRMISRPAEAAGRG